VVFLVFDRKGTFSYGNYQRICSGMTLADVERLLGAPGAEIDESFVPLILIGQPKQEQRVVFGDHYYRWQTERNDIGSYIHRQFSKRFGGREILLGAESLSRSSSTGALWRLVRLPFFFN
jgi:hypothetical protein